MMTACNRAAPLHGSPAGSVSLKAPDILNHGAINAKAPTGSQESALQAVPAVASVPTSQPAATESAATGETLTSAAPTAPSAAASAQRKIAAGTVKLSADTVVQSASGSIDVSGPNGGDVQIQATQDIALEGSLSAAATADGQGGSIALSAAKSITLRDAVLDASGNVVGGHIHVEGGQHAPADAPLAPQEQRPLVALSGNTQLRASSQRGQGGNVTLTADRVGLFDATAIDASGATGGGTVLVGGDYQGRNPDVANASASYVGEAARIEADATVSGNGGRIIVWADGSTRFLGSLSARSRLATAISR